MGENVQSKRLLSLDVMRGITIAGMILVNNPGSWSYIYAPLEHAEWNGLTPTDLVFPFFMFIMGVSMYFSLRKYDFRWSWEAGIKIIRRTVLLFLIGWAISWISRFWGRMLNPERTWVEAVFNFDTMRTLGVFPRLALCYFVTSMLALFCKPKTMKWIIAVMLVAYAAVLLLWHGFEFVSDNIVRVIDSAILGESHMYTDTVGGESMIFDPEGLLSTLPSIAHCIIGFLCGGMIVAVKDNEKRSYNLLLVGAVLTMSGFLLSYGVPLNKKVWSPTFVLTTCGLASMLLGILIWVIDIKGNVRWCTFFRVFGVNPLSLYVLSTLLAIASSKIYVYYDTLTDVNVTLHAFIYKNLLVPLCFDDMTLASLCYAVLFVLVNWCVGYVLYKKNIIIKI